MKRVLGSTMGHREYFDSIEHGKFGSEEYKFFCKLCDADGSSSFTLEDLKDRSYGFDLAYKYCMDNDETFPEITVFVNANASEPLCQISASRGVNILYYPFYVSKYMNYTWDELLNDLDETVDDYARILDV
jgi:hypothetical protein